MSPPENAYGRIKRQVYVEAVIREISPRAVLDFGCGTGSQLTRPLAQTFPEISFLGVDPDPATIAWAQTQRNPANLSFALPADLPQDRRFGVIIASEVLEHVEEPAAVLRQLRDRLTDNGRMVVTVPNGYGPFEAVALLEALLTLAGLLPALRRIQAKIVGKADLPPSDAITFADSPHINFFSRHAMENLFRVTGLSMLRFRSRTVFCGFIFDWFIHGPLVSWNASIADFLPAWCCSDWMFTCARAPAPATSTSAWRRSACAEIRRRVIERRWAGAQRIASADRST